MDSEHIKGYIACFGSLKVLNLRLGRLTGLRSQLSRSKCLSRCFFVYGEFTKF